MCDINKLCLESFINFKKPTDNLNIFSKEHANPNAKYTPPFLSKLKNIKDKAQSLNLKKYLQLILKLLKELQFL